MDPSLFAAVHAHTGVHTAVLELAQLEGAYAACGPADKTAYSARLQVALNDVVTQAARVGLREGYARGVKDVRDALLDANLNDVRTDLTLDRLSRDENVTHFVHERAFRG